MILRYTGSIACATPSSVDLSIDTVLPVQVLEGQPLVKGKATAIKAVIRKSCNGTAENASVRLTVGSSTYTRFYVAEPKNLDGNALKNDNSVLSFAQNEANKAIYFFDAGLAPTGSSFQASVTVDDTGSIPEVNEANNVTASSVNKVIDKKWGLIYPELRLRYFRTDWDNTPIPSFDDFYERSNAFIKGVFPVADNLFAHEKSSSQQSTRRDRNNRLEPGQLYAWIKTTTARMKVFHPNVDRFLAVVPLNWFYNHTTLGVTQGYNAQEPALTPANTRNLVIVEAVPSTVPNSGAAHVAAHEIGHTYDLYVRCEQYNQNCYNIPDPIGYRASLGLWVDRKIPITTARPIYSFMGAFDKEVKGTTEVWATATDYATLLGTSHDTRASHVQASTVSPPGVLAIGAFEITGSVTLDNWYALPNLDVELPTSGPYIFEYQDPSGSVLHQQSFDISYTIAGYTLTKVPFVFTIPYVSGVSKIVIKRNGTTLAQKTISAHAPAVTIMSPHGDEQLSGWTTVQWAGSDTDGDTLTYDVAFSSDNGLSWEPIATDLTTTSYN